ncbi:protein kilB [Streptomyces sp. NPDC005890]|uniref:protein kilB n=1 Tax=Streptomyces sp. NPDC005890 TaxID=3154568 RepID=UPI00340805E7
MWCSGIAVAGTLLGGAFTALLQSRRERTARAERRAEALRVALGEPVAALGDHRRALWHREDLRLNGASAEAVQAARAASHATRSAVTAPLVAVSVLDPSLTEPAQGRPGRVRPAQRPRPHRTGRPPRGRQHGDRRPGSRRRTSHGPVTVRRTR